MSDTPRTDAFACQPCEDIAEAWTAFARALERQLEESHALRRKLLGERDAALEALVEIERGAMAPFDSYQEAYMRGRARAALALSK